MTLDLSDVNKVYLTEREKVVAVDAVTLRVESGKLCCIYGASGSGKTTLINIMAGIEKADSGSVRVADQEIGEMSEEARADLRLHQIGVVFQTNNLISELTAQENISLPLLMRGKTPQEAAGRAAEVLGQVGLSSVRRRLPSEMSGGQRQRVGIARAIAGQQHVVLADEPSGALDSVNSLQVFELLRKMCDADGTTVVLATHDPLARNFADMTVNMVDGRVSNES